MTTVSMAAPVFADQIEIRTFDDILKAMSQSPAIAEAVRQRVLDDEIRQLPAAFRQLAATVESYMEQTNRILTELQAGQARHDEDIAELKAGQARLETGQARHDADIAELKDGQAEIIARQTRTEAHVADMRGQMVHLAARRMAGRIADVTQSRRPRWLESTDMVDIADTDGIPANELESFRSIDLTLKAIDKTSADGQEQYVIIECSGTITHHDIARIARNAEYMTRFTDLPCQAVAIGYTIPEAVAEAARAHSVHWLLVTNRVTHPR